MSKFSTVWLPSRMLTGLLEMLLSLLSRKRNRTRLSVLTGDAKLWQKACSSSSAVQVPICSSTTEVQFEGIGFSWEEDGIRWSSGRTNLTKYVGYDKIVRIERNRTRYGKNQVTPGAKFCSGSDFSNCSKPELIIHR